MSQIDLKINMEDIQTGVDLAHEEEKNHAHRYNPFALAEENELFNKIIGEIPIEDSSIKALEKIMGRAN